MKLTKKEIIQKLYDIEAVQGIKLGREVQKVIRNEIIPIEVIKVINKYDKQFLQIYDTYNTIYNSRNKNPLYRNLRNSSLEVSEKAIALSSLVTKILISCSKIKDKNDIALFSEAMNIQNINKAIEIYCSTGDSTYIEQCCKEIKDLLDILYYD